MANDDNFDFSGPPPKRDYRSEIKAGPPSLRYRVIRKVVWLSSLLLVVLAVLVAVGLFIWYGCRIEPASDQIVILIRKTGENLKPGEIISAREGQKGIKLPPLPEGRHFYNPYDWDWRIAPVTNIPAGKLGVVTRLYGSDLPDGEIIAPDGYKGIAADILRPGKYRVNPYAEKVEIFDAITIHPGHAGVMINLSGRDPLHGQIPDEMKNVFVVGENVKGVQENTVGPGTYYLNPYIYTLLEVNLQSQRFALQADDAISFLTQDGFTVVVEGTLEFAVTREKAAQLTHQVGDMDDILKKIILPKARGFSRIEGSKHPAIDFIVGETRQGFQDSLEKHLVTQCRRWGVEVRSMLIRNITPPEEVAAIIREREVALQNQRKIEQQIEQAKSQAELTRQEMLAEQTREKTESETTAIRARIQAEQEQSVKLTASQRELEVAKLEAEAAKLQADAIRIKAEADRDVVTMQNTAEAMVMGKMATSFGGGANLARSTLYQKTAPLINTIVSTDREPGLGGIFASFLPPPAGRDRNEGVGAAPTADAGGK